MAIYLIIRDMKQKEKGLKFYIRYTDNIIGRLVLSGPFDVVLKKAD